MILKSTRKTKIRMHPQLQLSHDMTVVKMDFTHFKVGKIGFQAHDQYLCVCVYCKYVIFIYMYFIDIDRLIYR